MRPGRTSKATCAQGSSTTGANPRPLPPHGPLLCTMPQAGASNARGRPERMLGGEAGHPAPASQQVPGPPWPAARRPGHPRCPPGTARLPRRRVIRPARGVAAGPRARGPGVRLPGRAPCGAPCRSPGGWGASCGAPGPGRRVGAAPGGPGGGGHHGGGVGEGGGGGGGGARAGRGAVTMAAWEPACGRLGRPGLWRCVSGGRPEPPFCNRRQQDYRTARSRPVPGGPWWCVSASARRRAHESVVVCVHKVRRLGPANLCWCDSVGRCWCVTASAGRLPVVWGPVCACVQVRTRTRGEEGRTTIGA